MMRSLPPRSLATSGAHNHRCRLPTLFAACAANGDLAVGADFATKRIGEGMASSFVLEGWDGTGTGAKGCVYHGVDLPAQ